MYDLCVIIPVAEEDPDIGKCIGHISAIFRDEQVHGRILVISSPNLETMTPLPGERKTCADLEIFINTPQSLSLFDALRQADARVVLFLRNPDSTRVAEIPNMYRLVRDDYDLVIGSKYLKMNGIPGNPLRDRVNTSATTVLARLFFPQVSDPLSDFFAVRSEVIAGKSQRLRGDAILLEVLGKTHWRNLCEIPLPLHSDTTGYTRYNAFGVFLQIASIGWHSFLHHESPAWKEQEKILRFLIVGISGIFVNMGVLYLLTSVIGIFYLVSSLVAIELSILNNFLWNDRWTFSGDAGHRLPDPWHRLGVYHLVSAGGVLINIGILFILTDFFGVYYLISNMIGILAAFAWNFLVNRNTTWKPTWGQGKVDNIPVQSLTRGKEKKKGE